MLLRSAAAAAAVLDIRVRRIANVNRQTTAITSTTDRDRLRKQAKKLNSQHRQFDRRTDPATGLDEEWNEKNGRRACDGRRRRPQLRPVRSPRTNWSVPEMQTNVDALLTIRCDFCYVSEKGRSWVWEEPGLKLCVLVSANWKPRANKARARIRNYVMFCQIKILEGT